MAFEEEIVQVSKDRRAQMLEIGRSDSRALATFPETVAIELDEVGVPLCVIEERVNDSRLELTLQSDGGID